MTDRLTLTMLDDVRARWPLIRQRVMAMAADCGEAWFAEDVFNELSTGNAYLWGTDELEGFLVVQVLPFTYGRVLHCWLCSNQSGEPPIAYWEQLLEIAREAKCVRVTFENDRKGFERAIPGIRRRYAYSFDLD